MAEHSFLAANEALHAGHSAEECLAVLLHDAAEAYVGDMVKPLKMLVGEAFSDVEERVEKAIEIALNIDFEKHEAVIRKFDHGMLIAERHRFFSADSVVWYGELEAIKLYPEIAPMSPRHAMLKFIREYTDLLARRNEAADESDN